MRMKQKNKRERLENIQMYENANIEKMHAIQLKLFYQNHYPSQFYLFIQVRRHFQRYKSGCLRQ